MTPWKACDMWLSDRSVKTTEYSRRAVEVDDADGLPVGRRGPARDLDVVVGAADRAGGLGEDHRLRRHLEPAFGGMVGIVQADADELADLADAGTVAVHLDLGQGRQVQRGNLCKRLVTQEIARNVRHMGGKVAHAAV